MFFWEVYPLVDFGIGFIVFMYICRLNSIGTAPAKS